LAPAAGVTGEGPAAGDGAGAAGRADGPGVGAPGLAGAALRGAAGFAPGFPAEPPPGPCNASVNLRTTGASIVEDAERTNSPSSWSLAMTTLLSTPNSLASSYTRTLATSLLLRSGVVVRRTVATSWAYSSRAHRVLIAISTYFQLAGVPDRTVSRAFLACLRCCLLDVPTQVGGIERSLHPKGPGKRPAADRQVETDSGRVHISTPTGQRTAIIRDEFVPDHHHTQQILLGRSFPATDARTLRACWALRPARHR
jgi:hypothetical protein